MEIRRATTEDDIILTQILSMFFAGEGFSATPGTLAERVPTFLDTEGNAAFLAVNDDEVLGVSTVATSFGFEQGLTAEIQDLFVMPAHRGGGVATALLGHAMVWSKQQGCDSLEVVITPEDADRQDYLISWYGRLGFIDTGRRLLHFDV